MQEQYGLAEQRAHGRLSGLKGRRLRCYPIPGSVLGADEKGSWEGVLKALGICEHGELILSASWPFLGILVCFIISSLTACLVAAVTWNELS